MFCVMNMKTYLARLNLEQKQALAVSLNTSVAYLSQIASGHRKASPSLAKKIEAETNGVVSKFSLRPDIYDAA